jgi:hypothetical protein
MSDGVRPWRESPVGGHGVAAGCVLTVHGDAAAFVSDVVAGLRGAHFREDEAPAAGVHVLRRGSLVADTLLTGTGLAALASRLGPLSLRATVVVESLAQQDGAVRVVLAMVAGDALAPEIAAAVDPVIARYGDIVTGPGWMRAVDVPTESRAHPRTAQQSGVR